MTSPIESPSPVERRIRPVNVLKTADAVGAEMPSVAESRALILDAIGPAPRMVFVRGVGNVGDELIWAGTRDLLRGHVYREIAIDDIVREGGDLALITGGGAWSRAYNEYMPELLAIAEERFERVIVLPSTFDVSVPRVRAALSASGATVFAREPRSFAAISGLCEARLAHDCAFFAELPQLPRGSGTLRAFRTDAERSGRVALPDDNDDISATATSLDDWLARIAAHELVETDRAHVAIAAALLGLRVRYAECDYFKVGAIAQSSLDEFDVAPLGPTAPARGDGAPTPTTDAPPISTAAELPFLAPRVTQLEALVEAWRAGRLPDEELAPLLPELRDADGLLDRERADLLMAALDSRGKTWLLTRWLRGELEAIFPTDSPDDELIALRQRSERLTAIENGGWWRLRGRLRRLLGRDR
jgi:exopolysaccharide biosynthesis predicted pyruvyltransferase EpsI